MINSNVKKFIYLYIIVQKNCNFCIFGYCGRTPTFTNFILSSFYFAFQFHYIVVLLLSMQKLHLLV